MNPNFHYMNFHKFEHRIKNKIDPFLSFDKILKSSNLFDAKNKFDDFKLKLIFKTPKHIRMTFKKYIFSKNGDSVVVI